MKQLAIHIIYSTRQHNPSFIKHLNNTVGTTNAPFISEEINDRKYSLSSIYNKYLCGGEAKSHYLVFCHDDLIFDTPAWGAKLVELFRSHPDYAVLGLAGTKVMFTPAWWVDGTGSKKEEGNLGIVSHNPDGNEKYTTFFSKELPDVSRAVALDGLFLAVNTKNIRVNFDPDFGGFHFYDVDFTVANHLAGALVGVTTDIRVTHKSIGIMPKMWEINARVFNEKYGKKFPITIKGVK